MSARADFAVFIAVIAATLGVAIAVGPAPAARADEIVVIQDDGPGPYWHRHPPYYYARPPRHHAVVVVEPAPPPVIVEPAPAPVAVAPAPAPQATAATDSYCREYQTVTVVDSKPVHSYGTACRQPDGSWKIVSQNP